ncbi:MAG TPA: PilZ domain-containing protein [Polyangiales bacterium]|nr:PilZ domain-containing protein [Polyangiales bacterium]
MQGRKSTRASVPLLPRYRSSSGFEHVDGQCLDISVGGMFIASSAPCETGTLLKFECVVDNEALPIKGVGRVVWQRAASTGHQDRPSGMGLKFIKLEPGTAEMIERLIREAQLQGMTAPTHPLPASYVQSDSFPPGSIPPPDGRLSASTRVSVVSTQAIDPAAVTDITGQPRPESQRVLAGTTPRDPAAASLPALGAGPREREPGVVAASRVALLPGDGMGSEVPAKLRAAARWISIALAVVVLAWTFLR